MEYNKEKVDEIALTLLCLTSFQEKGYGLRAWKGMAREVMNCLREEGFIGNPKSKSKAKSVFLTCDLKSVCTVEGVI